MPASSSVEAFGPFRLQRMLGRGGMAEAYLADRPSEPTQTFVLKRMRPDHARTREYEQRFLFEAQVASRVVHPNLARFREFGKVGDCYYLTMDQIRGYSLHRIFERIFDGGFVPPLPVAVHLGTGILDGLSILHRVEDEQGQPRPILHRDISPKNVIVDEQGEAVLIDFGIAKDMYGPSITLPGQLVGTARYMSPEHRRAEFLDPRSDVFSASVILFELLTGRHPWPPQNPVRELLHTVFDPPELHGGDRARVPQPMLDVLLKGLCCERESRFSDAEGMARAMREAGSMDQDEGAQAVAAWISTLDLPLDEELSTPVLDHGGGGRTAPIRVFWTSSGFLSSEQTAPEPHTDAEVLAVPPLPPRRDSVLEGERTEEMVVLWERRRKRKMAVGLILGVLVVLGVGFRLGFGVP